MRCHPERSEGPGRGFHECRTQNAERITEKGSVLNSAFCVLLSKLRERSMDKALCAGTKKLALRPRRSGGEGARRADEGVGAIARAQQFGQQWFCVLNSW